MSSLETRPGRRRSRRTLALAVFALYAAVGLPRVLQYGMFLDGVHFASVARNLAEGVGSFWAPHYTETVYPVEDEHPPLGFWLLSQGYRLFGDSVRVEAAYGFLLGLLNISLLMVLWRRLGGPDGEQRHGEQRPGGWLPGLFYVLLPMTVPTYASNLLEGPMSTFVLLAALASAAALGTGRGAPAGLLGLGGGALIFLAVLTKGPPGAFILVLPLALAWISERHTLRDGFRVLLLNFGGFLVTAATVILPQEAARAHVAAHYGDQVLRSLKGVGTQDARFRVLKVAILELAVPSVVALLAWWRTRGRLGPRDRAPDRARALGLMAVGLAGILPFLVTIKQYQRYVFPAMPFLVMALAALCRPVALHLERELGARGRRWVGAASALLAVGAVLLTLAGAGTVRKQEGFHRDFTLQPLELPPRQLISICPPDLTRHWELVANMQRQFKASLTPEPGTGWLLIELGHDCQPPPGCEPFHPPTPHRYRLFRCAEGPAIRGTAG